MNRSFHKNGDLERFYGHIFGLVDLQRRSFRHHDYYSMDHQITSEHDMSTTVACRIISLQMDQTITHFRNINHIMWGKIP